MFSMGPWRGWGIGINYTHEKNYMVFFKLFGHSFDGLWLGFFV